MAVYYHRLWALLREKRITQKTLTEITGISTATIFQMKRDEYVSLSMLDRIAAALNCDFKDIITNVDLVKEDSSEWGKAINLQNSREIVLDALNQYMKENDLDLMGVKEISALSLNTLKKFLRGENISQRSYYKLLRLGKEFEDLITAKCGGNIFGFL